MEIPGAIAEETLPSAKPAPDVCAGDGTLTGALTDSKIFDLTKDSSLEDKQSALANLSKSATCMGPTDLVLLRQGAVEALRDKTAMGSRDATALVAAALPKEAQTKGDDKELHGQTIALTDPEPWPDPVTGEEVLAELVRTLTRYVALNEGAATAIALWVLHAHAHDAYQISPILTITSPEKRCGKTTLVEVISSLVPRPLPSSSITGASLFRAIDHFGPTVLIDEADTFLKDKEELRGLLNSGHRRTLAVVIRTVGDQHEPRLFSTWAPKAIALIGKLPDTLADRSIEIKMRRRTAEEHVERLRLDRLDELEPLRQRLWTWTQNNLEELRISDPSLPKDLHDRAMDNWRPLVSIADLAGGVWPKRARKAALLLSGQDPEDDESVNTLLLGDIRDLFGNGAVERLASAQITVGLARREDRPWPEFRNGSPITVRQVARLLKRFDIKPTHMRIDGKTQRGYAYADFKDAFKRYLPGSHPLHPSQPNNDATNSGFPVRNTDPLVTDGESGEKPVSIRDVTDVTDENPPPAGNNGKTSTTDLFGGASDGSVTPEVGGEI